MPAADVPPPPPLSPPLTQQQIADLQHHYYDPSYPPLTQHQIADLQALDDLVFKTTTVEELHKIMNAGKKHELVQEEVKEELVQGEVKESVNDDSLLSSVYYASSDESEEEEDEDEGSSSSSDNYVTYYYHSVEIQGRGAVAVYRSKRAPKYKLYYFTASGKKAYLKKKHIGSIKRVQYYMLKSTDPISFMNNPANGCLHNGLSACWCENLNYYLNELYDV